MGMAELPSPVSVNNMKREKGQCFGKGLCSTGQSTGLAPGAGVQVPRPPQNDDKPIHCKKFRVF